MALKPAWAQLTEAVKELGAAQKLSRYQLQASWPELVGHRLAEHSQPHKIQGKTLLVVTRAPIWSQELSLRQTDILEAIRQRFGGLQLQHLRSKVGTLRGFAAAESEEQLPDLSRVPLSPVRHARVEEIAAAVQDPELRHSLKRALRQQEKRKQWLRQNGAVECLDCGALQDSTMCRGCLQESRRQRRQALFQCLGREPWLTYPEAAQKIRPLSQLDYHQARKQLLWILRRGFYEIREGVQEGQPLPSALRQQMVELCMLNTATSWDQLQERHILYTLGKVWGKAYLEDRAPAPKERKAPQPEAPPQARRRKPT